MIKRTSIMLLTSISLLVFTACGDDSTGGSSTTSKMKKKEFILIVQDSAKTYCKETHIKSITTGNTLGTVTFTKNVNKDSLLVSYESKNVNCIDDYERDDDDRVCSILNADIGTDRACVIGFDFY